MFERMKVFGRMTILRRITAADMAAGHAQTQVHPFAAGFQTLLTAARTRRDISDLIDVFTWTHKLRLVREKVHLTTRLRSGQ